CDPRRASRIRNARIARVVLLAALAAIIAVRADATVLCQTRGETLKLRDACRRQEKQLDPVAIGLQSDVLTKLTTLLGSVSLEDGGRTVRFSGVNVQIVSGAGATDAPENGVGNVIIGYNETRPTGGDDRSGSHNLVVGSRNNYTSHGGVVGGFE